MEFDPVALGARVKARRVDLGISQTALSEKALLGGHKTSVYRIETGVQRPTEAQLSRIAEVLRTSVAYLTTGDPDPAAPAVIEEDEARPKLVIKSRPTERTNISVYTETAEDLRVLANGPDTRCPN